MNTLSAKNHVQIKFGVQDYALHIPVASQADKTRVAESLIASGLSLLDTYQFQQIEGYDPKQLTFSWLTAD